MNDRHICYTCKNNINCKADYDDKFIDDIGIVADCRLYEKLTCKYLITVRDVRSREVEERYYSNFLPSEETKKKKASSKKNSEALVVPAEIVQEWKAYCDMRKKIKAPMTDYAAKLNFSKLDKLAPGDFEMQKAILNQSVSNCWKGLFALHEESKSVPPSLAKEKVGGQPSYDLNQIKTDTLRNTDIKGL